MLKTHFLGGFFGSKVFLLVLWKENKSNILTSQSCKTISIAKNVSHLRAENLPQYTLSAIIIRRAHWEEGPQMLAWKKARAGRTKDKLWLCARVRQIALVKAVVWLFSCFNGSVLDIWSRVTHSNWYSKDRWVCGCMCVFDCLGRDPTVEVT